MWRAELKNAIPTPVETSSRLRRSRTASARSPRRVQPSRPARGARWHPRAGRRAIAAARRARAAGCRSAGPPSPSHPRAPRAARRPIASCASSASTPASFSSPTNASRYDPRPVRDVGCGGEQPERREAEGRDRAELDDVPAPSCAPRASSRSARTRRPSPAGASTPPTSSIETRNRFFAVAS